MSASNHERCTFYSVQIFVYIINIIFAVLTTMKEESNSHDEKTDQFLIKLDEYARRIAQNAGYIKYDVATRSISTNGGSYMGRLYEIDITGQTEDGDKQTNVFVKNIIQSNVSLTYDVREVYKREHFVYSELYKQFDDIEHEKYLPFDERYKIPKALEECNDQTIILENLTAKGFATYYRMNVINIEYAELAVKNLARFHGLSFAMNVLRPDFFNKKIKVLDCILYFDQNWDGLTRNMVQFASSILDDTRKKVINKLVTIVDKYPSYMRDSTCIRTLCHGDYRHNNVMVKEVNGKPTEVMAVDYQIIHFGNPILDFIYLIFWGTDQEFRRNHLNNLKELYYQSMDNFLQRFDIRIEDVFPRKAFEIQYQDKLDFGLMIAVIYLPFLFPPEDDAIDVANIKTPLDQVAIKVDSKFDERFIGIVDDFIQWGYL